MRDLIDLFEAEIYSLLMENEQRVAWIEKNFGPKLLEKYESDKEHLPADVLIDIENQAGETELQKLIAYLMAADPTPGKAYTRWIALRYYKNNEQLEDVNEMLSNQLQMFAEATKSGRLKMNIDQIKSFADLYNHVAPFVHGERNTSRKKDLASQRDTSVDTREKRLWDNDPMLAQAEVVYDTNEWLVLIPKTHEASRYFGAQTNWCTTTASDGMFNRYSKQGPLYIILHRPDGVKYQFHFPSNQFMDKSDRPIDLNAFVKEAPEIVNVLGRANFINVALKSGRYGKLRVDAFSPAEVLKYASTEGIYSYIIAHKTKESFEYWPDEKLRDREMWIRLMRMMGVNVSYQGAEQQDFIETVTTYYEKAYPQWEDWADTFTGDDLSLILPRMSKAFSAHILDHVPFAEVGWFDARDTKLIPYYTAQSGLIWIKAVHFQDYGIHATNLSYSSYSYGVMLMEHRTGKTGMVAYKPTLAVAVLEKDGREDHLEVEGIYRFDKKYAEDVYELLSKDEFKVLQIDDRGGGFDPARLGADLQRKLAKEKPELDMTNILVDSYAQEHVRVDMFRSWWGVMNLNEKILKTMDIEFYADDHYLLCERFRANNGSDYLSPLMCAAIEDADDGVRVIDIGGFDDVDNIAEDEGEAVAALLKSRYVDVLWTYKHPAFQISKLPENMWRELVSNKPALGATADLLDVGADMKDVVSRLKIDMAEKGGVEPFSVEIESLDDGRIQIGKFSSLSDLVDRYGDSTLQHYVKMIDDEDTDMSVEYTSEDDVIGFAEDLPIRVQVALVNKAREQFIADGNDEEEFAEKQPWKRVRKYAREDWEAMERAVDDGRSHGAYNEMVETVRNCIKQASPEFGDFEFSTDDEGNLEFDEPVKIILSVEQLAKALEPFSDEEYFGEEFVVGEMEISMHEPQYGFTDFDDDAALSTFWDLCTLHRDLFQKNTPVVDLSKISRERLEKKFREAMAMLPEGIGMKKYPKLAPYRTKWNDLSNVSDEDLRKKLEEMIHQYYK